jgi:hypothetical protein
MADKRCFLHRTSLADVDVEEVKPPMGIPVSLCVHNYGAAETIKAMRGRIVLRKHCVRKSKQTRR